MVVSRLSKLLISALEKIIKNAAWRNEVDLVAHCKAVQNLIATMPCGQEEENGEHEESFKKPIIVIRTPGSFLFSDSGLPVGIPESELFLKPLVMAINTASPMVIEPAIDCIQKLIVQSHIQGHIDSAEKGTTNPVLFELIDLICKCHIVDGGNLELQVLRTLISAVTSQSLHVHGECLLQIVQTCYDIVLGSKSTVNQVTAKASLLQMIAVVFHRIETDVSTSLPQPILVTSVFEALNDKVQNNNNVLQFVQNFISMVTLDIEKVEIPFPTIKSPSVNGEDAGGKDESGAQYLELSIFKDGMDARKEELDSDLDSGITNVRLRDALLVFRATCRLSMKVSSHEALSTDPILMQEKLLSFQLIKFMLETCGSSFKLNYRFLGAIKHYLSLSVLKNSTIPAVSVFEALCSVLTSLMLKFRAGLKTEIGVFFPMLILPALENATQPSTQHKTIVLQFLEYLSTNPQVLADIFVNYDCDVESPNIFERIVNGLARTVQNVHQASVPTSASPQDSSFKLEAIKILTEMLRSIGVWMDKQLNCSGSLSTKCDEEDDKNISSSIIRRLSNGFAENSINEVSLQAESIKDISEASTIEQRRAYKLELQEGISLFNRKPSRGIDFLIKSKKLDDTPEAIALFLKNTSGLDMTMVGDYLGGNESLSLWVMHAYVGSFNFVGIQFDEAIRILLQGFRLPGEAQKIDRIMEKFAECYCKCNPKAFSSADTAYVLAYSVILLNTDAHNPTVNCKMSKADFIRNNRGIDNGNDLPEAYLGSLYDRIVKNEIKMKADIETLQSVKPNNGSKLGLDAILNLVIRKKTKDKSLEKADDLINHIQEQLKSKAGKTESTFYVAMDVEILRFMLEACWAPMHAAFSIAISQTDNDSIASCSIEGFCNAVHVTAVMGMQTQRDAFITTLAKFTSLHKPMDIKQKNIDAIKGIIKIAMQDGNHLQEAWENILTCISQIEYLHLLGEGVPLDAAFLVVSTLESEKATQMSLVGSKSSKKVSQQPAMSNLEAYQNIGVAGNSPGKNSPAKASPVKVSPEQMNKLRSNLNILEQVGSLEINHVFTHSEKLNSEAIVDFVKALCKVSMEELQSPTDPRLFSLKKIVEIAHYNVNRIRVVWSAIWNVLSIFFIEVGCSTNLGVAFFVMDSLRQLAMKFLEREELSNYNFQSEFMKPFVIVMQKSTSVEIRELIIRCVSHMVVCRVKNVKSGWKSIFMMFSIAASDEQKSTVQLAFETIEKIVREYFSYITETEISTFSDCVNCLIAFTNTHLNNDISLNAIAFLRFCAESLADGGLVLTKSGDQSENSSNPALDHEDTRLSECTDKIDHSSFWIPLLVGFSKLSFDSRNDIRKSALKMLNGTLEQHGHLFSSSLWNQVFESVLFPIFKYGKNSSYKETADVNNIKHMDIDLEQNSLIFETYATALQLLVDIFVRFYSSVRHLLGKVLELLSSFIISPSENLSNIGVFAFVNTMNSASVQFSDQEWKSIFLSLNMAEKETIPDFHQIVGYATVHNGYLWSTSEVLDRENGPSGDHSNSYELEFAIAKAKCYTSTQLLLVQVITDAYHMHKEKLNAENTMSLLNILSPIAAHAHKVNSDKYLRIELLQLRSLTQISDPPLLNLESESFLALLKLQQSITYVNPATVEVPGLEAQLAELCENILQFYIHTASIKDLPENELEIGLLDSPTPIELAIRAPLVVEALKAIGQFKNTKATGWISRFFPLLTDLISCDHGSKEVQVMLGGILRSRIGPILLQG